MLLQVGDTVRKVVEGTSPDVNRVGGDSERRDRSAPAWSRDVPLPLESGA
jgi:hypothetical protein